MMERMQWWHVRLLLNLVNGSTLLGLLVGLLGRGHFQRGPRGLVLCTSYRLGFPRAGAFTLGNVILSRHEAGVLVGRQRLLVHEERHSTQYAACLGLPLLLLYLLAAGWSWLRGGDFSTHNPFERIAGLEDGGYPLVSRRERGRYAGQLPR
ncbi:MAG TPA: hypothetical protein VFK52_02200 [Nocardioidaceae bacterium]|nr:hypothetical protein [Nocardioidaceae bacterium]